MNPLLILNVEFFLSLVVFSIVLAAAWVPWARRSLDSALLLVACANGLRHVGLIYVQPAAINPPMPASFAVPTAYGDLATAVLAIVAAVLLWRGLPGRYAATWVFSVVGFADLGLAVIHAFGIGYVEHFPSFGYLLPAIVVPALLAGHVFTFWALLRLKPPAL